LVDKISKVRRVAMKMTEELGREPTDEEVAEEIGISSAKVSQLKRVSIRPASLDAPISDVLFDGNRGCSRRHGAQLRLTAARART
jgi:DNA-directed RNA polymerase sigma subunit (sigma70/sigma32)